MDRKAPDTIIFKWRPIEARDVPCREAQVMEGSNYRPHRSYYPPYDIIPPSQMRTICASRLLGCDTEIVDATTNTQLSTHNNMAIQHGQGTRSHRSGRDQALPVSRIPNEGPVGNGDGHPATDLSPTAADPQSEEHTAPAPTNVPNSGYHPAPGPTRPTLAQMVRHNQGASVPPSQPSHPTRQPTKRKGQKTTRANIKIASLNIRGRWHNGADKWMHINQIIREQRIGIMALQETHLSESDNNTLNDLFSSRLHIISSIDPSHTNAEGVAIVINKNLMSTMNITSTVIIPGRALVASIPWHRNEKITILAIYAPNNPQHNKTFWVEVLQKLEQLPPPDIMLGDFNLVEDALDRLPPKSDNTTAVEALAELKAEYQLRDGWRAENPDSHAYTFMQSALQGGRKSRIDRIYINQDMIPFSREWDINPSGGSIPTTN
jgi:exonuclease III